MVFGILATLALGIGSVFYVMQILNEKHRVRVKVVDVVDEIRVRVLEEAGVVRGYHADLDAEALGYNVHVFAFVGLTSQAEVDLQAFEEMVAAWPRVRECHMLMCETDFLLKIVAHDWDDFQKFLTSKLTPAKNVSHVKTALSIRSAKKLAGVPVDYELASD